MQSEDWGRLRRIKTNRNGYVTLTLPDIHKLYQKDTRLKEKPILNRKLYREVIEFMFKQIWKEIYESNWIFTAPLRFGQFYVKQSEKKDGKGYYIDWQETRKQGKVVKKYNAHTGGLSFFVKWNKVLCKLSNRNFYQFNPYRGSEKEMAGSRGLSAWVKKCANDPYIQDFKGHII